MQDEDSFPSIASAFPPEPPKADDLILQDANNCAVGTDTASCMENCLPAGQKFKWLSHFPQGHLSVAQGFVGQRVAYFQGSQSQLTSALRQICGNPGQPSHWPPLVGASASVPYCWWNDCMPVDVQFGAAGDERTIRVFGNIADADISNKLESFNEYRIIVTYQLLHISDPWPIGKPSHPLGTTLTLQVRGGGETLMVDPNSISSGTSKDGVSGCFNGREPSMGFKDAVLARMRIPLTEYHLTCDRITDQQLCDIFSVPWKCREGTVNCSKFMNEDEGTLLFDTWTLDQTFVPDIDDPRRWRLGCVLKCREVPGMKGPYPCDCTKPSFPIGWNHDYKRHFIQSAAGTPTVVNKTDLGWRFIMMRIDDPITCDTTPENCQWNIHAAYTPHGNCPQPFVPRYQYADFSTIFCSNNGNPACIIQVDASPICTAVTDYSCATALVSTLCPDDAECAPPNQAELPKADDYADIQQRVAQIVDDARKARARKVMRDNERLAQGEIDVWPEGEPVRKEIVPVTVKPGGEIVYP